MSEAKRMLDMAARLAMRAAGRAEPNPLVGAVIVSQGRVIGAGHHRAFGEAHAEAKALKDAASRGEDVRGATMYVTLEPCAHTGKQPPCTRAVIEAGIGKVVYARRDPNEVASGGAEVLRAAGIAAELSGESRLATGVSDPFVRRVSAGLPWVVAKWAQTIDGRIATRSGESKWISSEASRARVHRLRGRVDAILTGLGTVVADDPLLTARGTGGGTGRVRRRAIRVVADSDLAIPLDSRVVRTAREAPLVVACDASLLTAGITEGKRAELAKAGVRVVGVEESPSGRGIDLKALMAMLMRDFGVATVMVESGPGLLGGMFAQDLIDEAVVYIAPMLLSDEMAKAVAIGSVAESLSQARRFELWRVKPIGSDVELTYRRLRTAARSG